MGPWLADTIRQCDGLVDMMSYWTFSDVFEEQGVVKEPFYGGYGLIAEDGLPKPAFNAFKLLHELGEHQDRGGFAVRAGDASATDGTIVMAVWNLFLPEETGEEKADDDSTSAAPESDHRAMIYRLDSTHGSLLQRLRGHGQAGLSHAGANSGSFGARRNLPPPEKRARRPRPADDRFAAARVWL